MSTNGDVVGARREMASAVWELGGEKRTMGGARRVVGVRREGQKWSVCVGRHKLKMR